MVGYSSASWANWCARNGCITKDTPPPFTPPNTTFGYTPVKYQDKLFTFIKHDKVPWNNNNAENAIRRFGYYREDNAGRLKESGLEDYLVLLSIVIRVTTRGSAS
jgi:hypothetical protein